MAMARKVEIMRRETIKPSSPTPLLLKRFKISFLDQLALPNYAHFIFFYTLEGDSPPEAKAMERCQRIKKSLSETLTHFYPLAGRFNSDNISIECNDEGVDFLESRVNCHISDVLRQPQLDDMKLFLPTTYVESTEEAVTCCCLLLVQLNFFECGGIAIGVSISHKIFDGSTSCMFFKGWATTTAFESNGVVCPVLNAASVFPPRDGISIMSPVEEKSTTPEYECITRRCVFDASKVAALKAKVASTSVPQPTRVEVVSALIWKCIIMASRSNLGSLRRQSMLCLAVNLRARWVVSLQENSLGNLVWFILVTTEEAERGIELPNLVDKLRRGIENFRDNYVEKIQGNEGHLTFSKTLKEIENTLRRDDIDTYFFSSLIRLPLYEIDFGWGRPTWVNVVSAATQNNVILMSTRGGDGIEVYVTLKEEDMAVFERDPELLQYASLDPSALNLIQSCL